MARDPVRSGIMYYGTVFGITVCAGFCLLLALDCGAPRLDASFNLCQPLAMLGLSLGEVCRQRQTYFPARAVGLPNILGDDLSGNVLTGFGARQHRHSRAAFVAPFVVLARE
jgi:hypothetical protein